MGARRRSPQPVQVARCGDLANEATGQDRCARGPTCRRGALGEETRSAPDNTSIALERWGSRVSSPRKWEKRRTRGRKLYSSRAKTRGVVARHNRADLEQHLEACRQELAQARQRLAEAVKQQAATSEMLRIVSNSPSQSVLDAVAENAARLCDANNSRIWRLEDNRLRLVASYGQGIIPGYTRDGLAVNRDTVTGRATIERRTIHVHDLVAEEQEYPLGNAQVKDEGYRTTLATPLLREDKPIGIILVRRMEVRPFEERQIALLETFADHAVVAIENVRLFEAEKSTHAGAKKERNAPRAGSKTEPYGQL